MMNKGARHPMKLTQVQIQELYAFTRQHYVEHYDLQTELVDHISNGVEAQWQKTPQLSFKEALNKEFKKFGVFGFMNIIAEKKKAMKRRYWKIILRFYKEFLKLPTLTIMLLAILSLFAIIRSIPIVYRGYTLQGILFLTAITVFIYAVKIKKRYKPKNEKIWLLQDIIFQWGDTLQIVLFFYYYPFGVLTRTGNVYIEFGLVTFTVCAAVLGYIMVCIIPQKAEELLEETYSEYKLI